MGFLFGLMIGGMAASGGGAPALNFGTIPFRCLSLKMAKNAGR